MHPTSAFGLGDGGAHAGQTCDASTTTYLLSYWARDRDHGRLPVELAVQKLTSATGVALRARRPRRARTGHASATSTSSTSTTSACTGPRMVADLPGGASRLLQRADGYVQTVKSGAVTLRARRATPAPCPAHSCEAADERRPAKVAAAFWAALYDRDWPRIRSFFGPDSIYYDVPTGPSTAGKGPDSIEARLRLGLEGLAGYDHGPAAVVSRAPWWSPSTPSTGAGPAASRSRCRSSRSSTSHDGIDHALAATTGTCRR